MGTMEIVFRIPEGDPRVSKLIRILEPSVSTGKSPQARPEDEVADKEVPSYIKLLLEYERRGGRVSWDEAYMANAAAYPDPRGAGGMYTEAAGYFERDESGQSYVLTDKARGVLEEYKQGESMRDTDYATELSRATLGDTSGEHFRIERLHVKSLDQEEIRFSWWKGDQMMPRPPDLPEDQLLPLFENAIREGVFSPQFLGELRRVLAQKDSNL